MQMGVLGGNGNCKPKVKRSGIPRFETDDRREVTEGVITENP